MSGSTAPHPVGPPSARLLSSRAAALGSLTAAIGAVLALLGVLSAVLQPAELYRDSFTGYDPPFDIVAGLLLVAISFRIRERSPVAWLFSLLAPALTIAIAVGSPNVFSLIAAVAATVLVAALYPYRQGFFRGSATGPEATQLLVVVSALITILYGMVGSRWLWNQFSPPLNNHSWVESLYFTLATISTNGTIYQPTQTDAFWFVILLILFGVGTFLTAVVVLFLPFLERRLERIAERLERAQMEDLSDHVIICGSSPEGRATADALRGQAVRAVFLTTEADAVERLKNDGYRVHHGDPASEDDLKSVGINRARALIAAGDSDGENLLTVITARGLQPRLRIVAVGSAPATLAKLRKAGADEAISLVTVAAQLVSHAALESHSSGDPHAATVGH